MSDAIESVRVLFADDLGPHHADTVSKALARALHAIAPERTVDFSSEQNFQVESVRNDAFRALEGKSEFDLILIDAFWRDDLDASAAPTEAARSLVAVALSRPNSVVILISEDAAELIKGLYGADWASSRPHAVLHKGHLSTESIVQGVIEQGFSVSRQPLRSLGVDIRWDMSKTESVSQYWNVRVPIEELAYIATARKSRLESLTIAPIGGGLSDSLTVLVEAKSADQARPLALMMKLSQDPDLLSIEEENQQTTVPLFPVGTFARLTMGQRDFGGWSSLAFEKVEGRTASSCLDEFLTPQAWNSLFEPLASFHCRTEQIDSFVPSVWMTGPGGLLTTPRWERVVARATDLKVDVQLRDKLTEGAAGLFENSQRLTAFSLVHGDLHSKNVLLRGTSNAFMVDAASIRKSGVWCEDLARFSVWLACELVASSGVKDAQIGGWLLRTLGLGKSTSGRKNETLNARVRETLSACTTHWHNRSVVIEVARDWQMTVQAELLRATYSVDSFEPRVRRATLEAAYGLRF